MVNIHIEKNPEQDRLRSMGVYDWPIWEKEVSTFPWFYGEPETCYFLEGDVVVTPANGDPEHVGKGDLVRFPAGLKCTWEVRQPVRKHYMFGSD